MNRSLSSYEKPFALIAAATAAGTDSGSPELPSETRGWRCHRANHSRPVISPDSCWRASSFALSPRCFRMIVRRNWRSFRCWSRPPLLFCTEAFGALGRAMYAFRLLSTALNRRSIALHRAPSLHMQSLFVAILTCHECSRLFRSILYKRPTLSYLIQNIPSQSQVKSILPPFEKIAARFEGSVFSFSF